ncbi:competence protein CoiA family protein [Deinococcus radiophilus]|uniref:competence protein CoiA family protein n=1 Tax=Deinococcus radiophilus TaxID=32062 RepID=UPI00361CF7AC
MSRTCCAKIRVRSPETCLFTLPDFQVWERFLSPYSGASSEQSPECPVHTELEPETMQHIEMKKALAAKLVELYGTGEVQFESRVQEAGRIADVLLTLPDGSRIAGEAQYSPIVTAALQTRTMSYLDAGIEVIWAFEDSKASRRASSWGRSASGCWSRGCR